MYTQMKLVDAAVEIGTAIRRPETLALRWRAAELSKLQPLIAMLLVNAFFGLAAYALTMQLHNGPGAMLRAAALAPVAAGGAWLLALPALYIFNSGLGSRLRLETTVLAAAITVCFGSWALLASVPINWFFTLALPFTPVRWLVNVVVFAGVGLCMTDVFVRIIKALEPDRSSFYAYLWVGLLGVIGAELFSILDIFTF